jgi:predicted dehydrogenase
MIRLAIIGTGGMANMHAEAFVKIPGVQLVAGCDIDAQRAAQFCAKHGIACHFTDFGTLLRECPCDAVAVVTPDATHAQLSLQAIAAGKHVLCEKPLATCAADAQAMADAARDAGVIHMVNLSYRNSSAWQRLVAMTQAGELGTIRHVEAHYLQSWLTATDWGDWRTSPNWLWRLSSQHGSKGALGDIGVHILDFATMPVGTVQRIQCRLTTFDKAPGGRIGNYTLDANDTARILVDFANGAVGTVTLTRMATGHRNSLLLSIHGERGAARIDLDRSYQLLDVCRLDAAGANQPWETVFCGESPSNFQRFISSIKSGTNDQPDFTRGAELQIMLDACEVSSASERPIALG